VGGGEYYLYQDFLGTLLRLKIKVCKTCVSRNSQQFAQATYK
jgi:hypothetical protein